MTKNVFVLGLTDLQRKQLGTIRNPAGYAFHDLIGYEPLVEPREPYVFADLLERGRRELAAFDGTIDAVIAHWDFPTSVLAPILAHEHGIPAPSLESVLKCEHKYWSRLEQRASVPDHVPGFAAFDPVDDVLARIGLEFPFWVKPVKSHSSQLGFAIGGARQLEEAVGRIRDGIHTVGHAFDEVLAMVDLPPEIRDVPGTACLAESIMSGVQAAPEGSMARGRFDIHGVVDMHKDEAGQSIVRLDYPARLVPPEVQRTMAEVSERYLRHVGFDDSCFNVEFLWNPDSGRACIIEVNTRMSQSHSDLFAKVDGMSNHEVAVDIALGQEPQLPDQRGPCRVAAKCIVTHDEDGVVTRIPSDEEIDEIHERFPGTEVVLEVAPGDRLAEMPHQDPFSYAIAVVYVGADDVDELEDRRRRCFDALHFEFDPPPGEQAPALAS